MLIEQTKTAIESYSILKLEGKGRSQKEKVFDVLKNNFPITDNEISIRLGIPIRQITARRNQLLKEGKIKPSGTTFDGRTRRTVLCWTVNPQPEICFAKKSNSAKLSEIKDLCKGFENELAEAVMKIISS